MMDSGSTMSVPPQPVPGFATWNQRPGVDLRPRISMPEGRMSRQRPAWCSVSTPVMWSSTTTTSSTQPYSCLAKMPMVAEPQPTRMRCSSTPLTMGARPACTTICEPPSMASSTGCLLPSACIISTVTRPSFLLPPVRWCTPPSDSICEPYSAVVTCPTTSPRQRTFACSGPR